MRGVGHSLDRLLNPGDPTRCEKSGENSERNDVGIGGSPLKSRFHGDFR